MKLGKKEKAGGYDVLMETSMAFLQKVSNSLDRWVYIIVYFFISFFFFSISDGEIKTLSDLTSTVQQFHHRPGNRTRLSYSQSTSW